MNKDFFIKDVLSVFKIELGKQVYDVNIRDGYMYISERGRNRTFEILDQGYSNNMIFFYCYNKFLDEYINFEFFSSGTLYVETFTMGFFEGERGVKVRNSKTFNGDTETFEYLHSYLEVL